MYLCIILGKKDELHMQLINEKAFFYSKQWKKLEKISKYWRKMADQYAKRLDEGALIDSQDEMDHRVQPMDPNVMSFRKK